jgi:hypothetical protein
VTAHCLGSNRGCLVLVLTKANGSVGGSDSSSHHASSVIESVPSWHESIVILIIHSDCLIAIHELLQPLIWPTTAITTLGSILVL